MRMGEQCMDKVTQSEAINKKTKKKKKKKTGDKQKYWRRKIPKILSEEFNSGLDQVE